MTWVGTVLGGMELRRESGTDGAIPHSALAELEAEQKLVEANRALIARMEQKMQAKLAAMWGEEENGRKESQEE